MPTIITRMDTGTIKQIDDFREAYIELEPDQYPTATLLQIGEGAPGKSEKIQTGEQDIIPMSTAMNMTGSVWGTGRNQAADVTGNRTVVFVFDDVTGMQEGGYFRVPRTGEYIKIGDVVTATNTVGGVTPCTRAALGSSWAAPLDDDTVEFTIQEQAEAFEYSAVTANMVTAEDVFNYYQIYARKLVISETQKAIMANGGIAYGQDYQDQIDHAIKYIKRSINYDALNGLRYKSSLTRHTGGIRYFAGYNNSAVGDLTTRVALEAAFQPQMEYMPATSMVACSPVALRAFGYAYQGGDPRNNSGEVVRKAGVKLREIELNGGGTLMLYKEPALKDYNDGGVLKGQAMVWPKNGDFQQIPLISIGRYMAAQTGDYETEIVKAEIGFKIKGAKQFGVYSGITDPTA